MFSVENIQRSVRKLQISAPPTSLTHNAAARGFRRVSV